MRQDKLEVGGSTVLEVPRYLSCASTVTVTVTVTVAPIASLESKSDVLLCTSLHVQITITITIFLPFPPPHLLPTRPSQTSRSSSRLKAYLVN